MRLAPIAELKALVDTLAELEIAPLHLHVDTRTMLDGHPVISMWMPTRSAFFAFCDHQRLKVTERPARSVGQREWYAESDMKTRGLLVQCVSLVHHEDWEPRPEQVAS